jgi:hypothetical protein
MYSELAQVRFLSWQAEFHLHQMDLQALYYALNTVLHQFFVLDQTPLQSLVTFPNAPTTYLHLR